MTLTDYKSPFIYTHLYLQPFIQVPYVRIWWNPGLFHRIPIPFHWNPLESSGIQRNPVEWMHSCRNLWGIKKYSRPDPSYIIFPMSGQNLQPGVNAWPGQLALQQCFPYISEKPNLAATASGCTLLVLKLNFESVPGIQKRSMFFDWFSDSDKVTPGFYLPPNWL